MWQCTRWLFVLDELRHKKNVIAISHVRQQKWLCLLSLVYFFSVPCAFVLLSLPPSPLYVSGSVFQTECETRIVASWHTEGVLVLVAAVHSKVIWHLKAMLCAIAHSLRQACWHCCLAKRPLLSSLTNLKLAAKCFREEDGLIVSATAMPLLHFSLFPS